MGAESEQRIDMDRDRKKKNFGRALATARNAAGLSQRELGSRVGGSVQGAISSWEKGTYTPDPDTVFAIEGALEVVPGSLSQLLGYMPLTEGRGPAPETESAIMHDPFLSTTQRRTVLEVYRSFRSGQDHPHRARDAAGPGRSPKLKSV